MQAHRPPGTGHPSVRRRGRPLGAGPAAWALAAAAATLLAIPAAIPAQTLSPGPLARPHEALDHADRCGDCHVTGREVGPDRCLKCHPRSGAGPRLHGTLVRDSGKGCGDCHPEHQGRGFHLVRLESQVPGFTHDRTGFPLEGRHQGLECRRCHGTGKGLHGVTARCADCHADRHGGQFRDDCARCHDAGGFAGARGFDHGKAWPLEGRHATVPCAKCHADRDGKDRRWNGIAHGTCDACHRDPHGGSMKRPCADCHAPGGWKELSERAGREHAPGRFPLEGRHRSVPCARCHGERMERKVEARCAACHAEPHGGRLGPRCEGCHDAQGWRQKAGAPFDHDRTAWPLAGRHARVACGKCHGGAGPYEGRVRGRPHGTCRDCHADAHGTVFASVPGGDRCESCHGVEGWTPASYGLEEHGRSAFPLQGAHRAVPCGGRCHRPATAGGAPAEGIAGLRLKGTPTACGDCHPDPHGGAFATRAGTKGCAACHSSTSWKAADFDHASTRFPLTGRHQGLPCRRCHAHDQGGAATSFAGLDRRCASCHEDPHAGQFSGERARDCGDCHDTGSFRPAAFDHGSRTSFPLAGAHAAAPCASCHPAVTLPWGGQAALYRPVPAACAACHADPHRGRTGGLPCGTCHRETGWRDVADGVDYEHRRTGFPLDGAHGSIPCRRCHGGTQPRAPEGTCAACHRDPHRGAEGEACDRCHTPAGWSVGSAVRDHERTRFPLTGAHRVADCAACHAAVEPPAYGGTPRECVACHEADARRPGLHPDHVQAGFPDRCDECHGTWSWGLARITHSWWPLRGAHAGTECFRCHADGRYGGTPDRCEECHGPDYDRATDPAHGALGFPRDCRECHGESGWSPARSGWHDDRFPLRGDHRALACADCHGGSTATFSCTGCHAHAKDRMDREHRERGGYAWESGACLACHPRGDD